MNVVFDEEVRTLQTPRSTRLADNTSASTKLLIKWGVAKDATQSNVILIIFIVISIMVSLFILIKAAGTGGGGVRVPAEPYLQNGV